MTAPERRDTLAAVDGEPATYESSREDQLLVQRLRAGDEAAFMELVDRYGMQMLRVARMYVSTRAAGEEVVQETWLAVLSGLDRFEAPLLAEDLDLPHPHEPREDARHPGAPRRPVLVARRRRPRTTGRPSSRSASSRAAPAGRGTGRATRPAGATSRRSACWRRS